MCAQNIPSIYLPQNRGLAPLLAKKEAFFVSKKEGKRKCDKKGNFFLGRRERERDVKTHVRNKMFALFQEEKKRENNKEKKIQLSSLPILPRTFPEA